MCESVPDDCFYECSGELRGCIQHRIAPGRCREVGVCQRCSQRRSGMPLRHDPVAIRKRCPDQERLDQAQRIAAFGHVKVEPNPAADRTSWSPPDCQRSTTLPYRPSLLAFRRPDNCQQCSVCKVVLNIPHVSGTWNALDPSEDGSTRTHDSFGR